MMRAEKIEDADVYSSIQGHVTHEIGDGRLTRLIDVVMIFEGAHERPIDFQQLSAQDDVVIQGSQELFVIWIVGK